MQYLRSKAFDVLAVLWTLLLSPALPFLWLTNASSKHVRAVSQLWARGLMVLFRTVVKLDYVERGKENIPPGPCLIVCNHQSIWETLALSTIFPDASFVAKVELASFPIVGWFLARYPMIMLDRSAGVKSMHQMAREARQTIEEGRRVVIFPQGTRQSVGTPVKFKRGAAALYAELGIPALPVALNSGLFWPTGQLMRYSGTITISYLPPIAPGLSVNAFKETAERVISAEADRLAREIDGDKSAAAG